MSACPICGAATRPDKFMCRTHWFHVPKALRGQVWNAYRAYQRNHSIQTVKALRDAHAAAEAAVREKLSDANRRAYHGDVDGDSNY